MHTAAESQAYYLLFLLFFPDDEGGPSRDFDTLFCMLSTFFLLASSFLPEHLEIIDLNIFQNKQKNTKSKESASDITAVATPGDTALPVRSIP